MEKDQQAKATKSNDNLVSRYRYRNS